MAIKAGPKQQITKALPVCTDAVEFIEQCTGPLYQWQRPIVADLTAENRPRLGYVQVPRKNGKSRLVASIAIAELCMKQNRQIFLISDSERNLKSALWFEIVTMLQQSPDLVECVHVFKDKIECPETGSFIALRPNNLSASQSINPHLVLFDEVHMQKTDQIWNGMQLANAARSDGLLLGITTPGYSLVSLAHDLYQKVRVGDPRLYGVVYQPANPDCEPDDQQALAEANPILIDRPDMAEIFAFERETLPEHEYRRFRLGQWTATASAWLPYGAWDLCALDRSRELEPGERIWVGFDGSFSGDSTALVAVTSDLHVVVLGCWENPGARGWRVPRNEVEDAVAMAMADYSVQELLCDPPYWQREISEWAQKWPNAVVEFPTGSSARMAPACTALYAGILEGKLTHNGDERLARHLSNAIVKTSPAGDYITKPDQKSPAKIDLAVALAIAFSRAATNQKPARQPFFVGRA